MKDEWMKNLSKAIVIMAIVAILTPFASCQKSGSKFLGEKIEASNLAELMSKIKEEGSLSKEETEYLVGGITRLGEVKDSIVGKTIGQVIESQKAFAKTNSYAALVAQANRLEMSMALTVRGAQKLMAKNDTLDMDGCQLFIKNNSSSEIKAIKGEIRFVNQQSQLIKVLPVNWDNANLKPNTEIEHKELWKHNPDLQFDKAYRELPNVIPIWVAESITFSDGKKLNANPQNQPVDKK